MGDLQIQRQSTLAIQDEVTQDGLACFVHCTQSITTLGSRHSIVLSGMREKVRRIRAGALKVSPFFSEDQQKWEEQQKP